MSIKTRLSSFLKLFAEIIGVQIAFWLIYSLVYCIINDDFRSFPTFPFQFVTGLLNFFIPLTFAYCIIGWKNKRVGFIVVVCFINLYFLYHILNRINDNHQPVEFEYFFRRRYIFSYLMSIVFILTLYLDAYGKRNLTKNKNNSEKLR